ncbi:hypothetical protein TEA_007033 [Camellia sinensis var. sinensis]|uniref:Leucine-rich repeat-containing N-terminal plant-type domain-containing protein n=1 Tax=Camellia sinensis var. sinensis TaxID=542762 RepID=A0A4V3WK18_CAMSN|nr:hypothetical protein TEA_007033 [Camellia sinensis var. sinensis]
MMDAIFGRRNPRIASISLEFLLLLDDELVFVVFLHFSINSEYASAAVLNNETDKFALVEFKSQMTEDLQGILASWNGSIHFCLWTGVTCGRNIPAPIGNHTFLQELYLSFNNLEGEVPDSISQLRHLRLIGWSVNSLSGVFPPSLYSLSLLQHIALSYNNFVGNLRPDLGLAFPNLLTLYLGFNYFFVSIPASLSNASYL